MLDKFDSIDFAPFLVPCIFGFVHFSTVQKQNKKIDFVLISKKDNRRPGKRFIVRGLDKQGNAVNFVETENIYIVHESQQMKFASYVQTRGSIPLFWSQKPNLAWAPKVAISPDHEQSLKASKIHMHE